MWGTLEIGVLVAITNDLDGLIFIYDNEPKTDETDLETEGKGSGGKSTLFNLKEKVILYDILNSLWLLQMMLLEASIELNIDSTNFRFPFAPRCNLSE